MTLFLLSDAIRHALSLCDDGELSEDVLAHLDSLVGDFNAKCETYCKIIREREARAAALTAEIDRLSAARTAVNNDRDRLKDRLHQAMVMSGQRKVEGELFKVSLQKSPPSARCLVDPETLNVHFQRRRIEPDAKAAIEWWKVHGEPPTGFEITQSDHIRIR